MQLTTVTLSTTEAAENTGKQYTQGKMLQCANSSVFSEALSDSVVLMCCGHFAFVPSWITSSLFLPSCVPHSKTLLFPQNPRRIE